MPIAMGLAVAALLWTNDRSAAALEASPRPVIVTVVVAPTISVSLVTRVLGEAGVIWRAAGFTLVWHRLPEEAVSVPAVASSVRVAAPATATLRVVIGGDRGIIRNDPNVKTLGWIIFEAGSPQQEIYISYANATALFEASQEVVGRISSKTIAEREMLLGRAMGRALAHEIGHYLLASKIHTAKGLMQAKRGAAELFSPPRSGFQLLADERRLIAARLNTTAPVARARPSGSR
jgi:hypothetical protein